MPTPTSPRLEAPLVPQPVGPWRLSLAGLAIDAWTDESEEAAAVDARFGAYARPVDQPGDPAATLSLRVTRTLPTMIPQPAAVPWPGVAGVRVGTRVVFERTGERLTYDPATLTGASERFPGRATGPSSSLDTPLRLMLSYELPRRSGLLLHAAGYADARGAVVFPAESGRGKSTTAAKLPAANVLSDDQVALRREGGEPAAWTAYALPFVGLFERATVPRRAPLRAVVFLAQAPQTRLSRVTTAVALARALSCAPWYVQGDGDLMLVMDRAEELVRAVPCYELAIALGDPVMPYIDALLG